MAAVNKFILILLFIFFGILMQQSHFFYINGAGPNFYLVGILFLGFLKEKIRFILAVSLVLLLFSYVFMPFWFLQTLILLVIANSVAFGKKILTGNEMIDFLISIILGTVLFYFFLFIFEFSEISVKFILIEMVYNLILGVITSLLFLNRKRSF